MQNYSFPSVSVIMSVYNTEAQWLRESIESILHQTYKDFELILILDCPTDNSASIIEEYLAADDRIRIIKNKTNIGLTKSLNLGLTIARGKYIARMDADDISVLTRFEKQVAYLDSHSDTVAVGARCYLSSSHKPVLNDWTPDQEVLSIRLLFANAGLPHPSAMIRHSVLENHHIRYTESIRKSQDYQLWIDLLPYGNLVVMPEILLIYREHKQQISANKNSQDNYRKTISLQQARRLLGELTKEEEALHSTINEPDLPASVGALDRYFRRILKANQENREYSPFKLQRELNYYWCRKAFRRLLANHNADLFFSTRTLCLLKPSFILYYFENYRRKRNYYKEIRQFEKQSGRPYDAG